MSGTYVRDNQSMDGALMRGRTAVQRICRGIIIVVLAFGAATTWAANVWDGGTGTDGNWNTGANWDNDAVPTFPVALTFAGTNQLASTNDLTGITVNGITFNSAIGSFIIGGNAIKLGGNIAYSASPASNVTQTINLNMALSRERTVATVAKGQVALGGVLSGPGGLLVSGGGTNTISGNNTFTGGVTLASGALRATTTNALGSVSAASLRINGGVLQLAGDANTPFGRNTVVSNSATISPDRLTSAGTSMTHTMGTLSIGSQTLTVAKGTNVTGTAFGLVSFGATTLTGDPVFDVMPYSYVQFGAVTESGGARTLTLNGNGTNPLMILNGTGNWTGGTVVNGSGFLRAAAANSLGASGSTTTFNGTGGVLELRNANSAAGRHVVMKGNTLLNLKNNAATTFSIGSLSIDPGLTVRMDVNRIDGSNTGNTHTLGGPVTSAGNAQLDVTGGNSFKAALSGAITLGGTLTVNPTTAPLTISGAIDDGAGAYGLVKTGTGLLTLSGANGYDGGTTVSAGRLMLGSQVAATNGGPVLVNGGVYDLNGLTAVTNGAVTLVSGAISNGTLRASSYALGGGLVYANLAGAGALSCEGGLAALLGNNTYSGGTAINGGVLIVPTTAQLPGWNAPGGFSVAGGAGLAVGNAVTDGNVATILGTGNFAAGAGFGFDTSLGDRTYSAVLADTGAGALGLVKVGANTLTLSSGNTYSGGTAVLGGTLFVPDGTALGAGGGLMLSNNAALRFGGDTVLENLPVLIRGGGYLVGEPGCTLTVTNDLTLASGTLNITGACTVVLGGSNTYSGHVYLNNSRLSLLPGSTNVINGMDLRPAGVAGSTGAVYQTGGYVSIAGGQAGLCIGTGGGSAGEYTLDGGTLEALTSGNRGMLLGVNSFSTGTFTMVSGVVTGNMLQVSRSDSSGRNSAGYYYQADGTSRFSTLTMAGNSSNSHTNLAVLAITNGIFSATSFSGLASAPASTAILYFGPGAQVSLGAFNATRGADSYSELTFDGGTFSPLANSSAYISALTHAYITDGGVTFDVPSGRYMTVLQDLENAPGSTSGGLTKAGNGVLTLAGSNTYGGNTAVSAGVLSIATTGALPGWDQAGRYSVANGAGLCVGNAISDADIDTLFATGNLGASADFGFDTSAGSRTISSDLSSRLGSSRDFLKLGANTLTLDGANTYSGWTIVYGNNGTGLVLSNTTGAAIQGGLQVGAAGDIAGNVYVKTLAPNQFGPSSVLFMNRGLGVNSTPVFELLDNNQVVAGLSCDTAAGSTYIENTQTETGYLGSILTVSNSTDNSYNSYIRNISTGGSGTLGITKDGPAVLTLSGANITYSGPTLVKAGALVLSNTTAFGSVVTVEGGQLLLATPTALYNKSVTNLAANGLGFLATNTFAIGGLNGSGSVTLENDAAEAVVLTVGSGNAGGSFGGALGGSGSVVKIGTGEQAFTVASTFTGPFVLGNGTSNTSTSQTATAGSGGFVLVGHNDALGAGAVDSLGAQLRALSAGLTLPNDVAITNNGGLRFGGANDLTLSGDVAIDGLRGVGNYSLDKTLTLSGTVTVSAGSTFIFDGVNGAETNGTIIVSGAITGEGNVTVADSFDNGKAVLTGANTYTGNTTVNQGKLLALEGSGSISQSAKIVVEDTAKLDVSGLGSTFEVASGQILRGQGAVLGDTSVAGRLVPRDEGLVGTLTVAGDLTFQAGGSATFDLGSRTGVGGTTNDLLVVDGDLAAGGTLVINVTETLDTAGTYRLINYTGALSGSFAVSVNGRYNATLDTSTPGQINVTFAAAANKDLVWKGAAGYATWDQALSTNWSDGGPTWTEFFALDDVTFDGSAEENTVQVSGFVAPSSIAVSGANDVTLAGAGEIAGATALSKSGAGTLTIATANTYAGGTAVSEGRLRVGSNSAVGTGTLTLGAGTAISSADSATARTISAPTAFAGDVTLGDATDSAALTLSGNNTLTASRTLTVPSDVTLGGVIGESGGSYGLTKAGGGNLTLNKANTFTGSSTVEAGTLTVAAVAAPATTLDLPLLTVKSGATAVVTGTGSSLGDSMDVAVESGGTLSVEKNDVMGGLSGEGSLLGTHASSIFTLTVNNGDETTEFAGDISYVTVPLSLAKTGSGTLTLSGSNDYRATTVSEGRLRAASATALPYGTPLTLGITNAAGVLDLDAYSQTVGSLNVNSTSSSATNRILIAAGETLSVTGNVTVGVNTDTARTVLTASGGGTLRVVNPGGTIRTGIVSGTDKRGQATVDLSGLALFDMDLGSGSMTVSAIGDNSAAYSHTFTLAESNTLRAATVTIGGSALGNSHIMKLGSGPNDFRVNSLNLGTGSRDGGKLLFSGANGTLTLRDSSGAGRANVTVAIGTMTTGYVATNVLDGTGHECDLLIGTLRMGEFPNRVGAWRNTFSFDEGVLDISDVILAGSCKSGTSGLSTLNLGGGVVDLGSVSLSASTATGIVNVTGGTVTLGGDIVKQPAGRGMLTLSGGTLDMQGNSIGSAAAKIDVVSLASGTLMNLAGFNGGDPLVKTGTGTLEIAGANTYGSTNRVTAGTLLVNGTLAATSPVIVTNAALGGAGTIGGWARMDAPSVLLSGGTNTTANVLSVGEDLTLAAGVTNVLDCSASTNSYVAVTGNLAIEGPNVVDLSYAGPVPPRQVTVFTFGTVTGEANLGAWTVAGVNTSLYNARVIRDGNRIIIVTSLRGLLIFLN